jgi:hypothetical protein
MGGLFSSDVPPVPKPKPPAPMPDEESPLVKEAGRRQALAMFGSSGRRSTILSSTPRGPSANNVNFDSYDRRNLG